MKTPAPEGDPRVTVALCGTTNLYPQAKSYHWPAVTCQKCKKVRQTLRLVERKTRRKRRSR